MSKPGKEHEAKANRFDCDECDFVTYKQASMYTHKRTKHKKVRYECGKCQRKYNRLGL